MAGAGANDAAQKPAVEDALTMLWQQWLEFALCSAVIFCAGWALSWSGDVLAEKTGLGRTWIGLMLLATVTSLPELFSGLSAITIIDAPDILVGSLLGSCVFNLAIIAIIDLVHRPGSIYTLAGQSHILSAGLGIGLIAFVGFMLLMGHLWGEPAMGSIGVSSPIILGVYLLACRMTYYFERQRGSSSASEDRQYEAVSGRRALIVYLLAAVFVVVAAMRLPLLAETIAREMDWNQSFVGTLFVAFSTSVPELVVTLSAVRLGALDLAISNVLGSNLFNMAIVGVLDPFYLEGPILQAAQPVHATTAFSALIMSTLVIIGLIYRPQGRVLKTVSWISILLVAAFILNAFLLYSAGASF